MSSCKRNGHKPENLIQHQVTYEASVEPEPDPNGKKSAVTLRSNYACSDAVLEWEVLNDSIPLQDY